MKRIIVLIGMVFVFLACTGDFKEIKYGQVRRDGRGLAGRL